VPIGGQTIFGYRTLSSSSFAGQRQAAGTGGTRGADMRPDFNWSPMKDEPFCAG
jgi:hypothetical protein